jgi:hypothetical protein
VLEALDALLRIAGWIGETIPVHANALASFPAALPESL